MSFSRHDYSGPAAYKQTNVRKMTAYGHFLFSLSPFGCIQNLFNGGYTA